MTGFSRNEWIARSPKEVFDFITASENAPKIAQSVKSMHPVFTSIKAVDGEATWDYVYTASPPSKKTGPPKALVLPTGNADADWLSIEQGNLMDLTNYDSPEGTKMNLNPNFISDRDKKGRTNKIRASKGLTSFLSHDDFVELHHSPQHFFGSLNEHSHSFHQSVVDDPDYHPMADDPAYISWRGEVAWSNGKIKKLGTIYNSIRRAYWKRRY